VSARDIASAVLQQHAAHGGEASGGGEATQARAALRFSLAGPACLRAAALPAALLRHGPSRVPPSTPLLEPLPTLARPPATAPLPYRAAQGTPPSRATPRTTLKP
jgi:hypothetical protein